MCCFARSLKSGDDVVCQFNHGMKSDVVLGRTGNGTLVLTDGPKGLDFRCQLDPAQSFHRDLYSSVKRGDISECSFANSDER
jgi:HK97 family phage prohead protease